jgi:2-amino-4-hydroxy-6-hydroxymethyldihydropteridine diphosphokinase
MYNVYLLTGSNQGDRLAQLNEACRLLEEKTGKIRRRSSIYETASWGLEGLPAHYNQALWLETDIEPFALLEIIHTIENLMGRVRQQRWGVRNLDIDIIYFENFIIQQPELWIPHPLMQERNFVLAPLAEIAPGFIHPVLLKTNKALLAESADTLAVKVVEAARMR